MENLVEIYLANVIQVLQTIGHSSQKAIHQAAESVASAIQNGGMFLLFGSGHSALIAKDSAYRAGGLAAAMMIDDIADGDAERLEGLAQYILARYNPTPESVLAIISNSGINPVPIEMAMLAKAGGLNVIAITSLMHSNSVKSRHSSGKKLFEVADIVIDTHGAPGDASIQLPGSPFKTGATSTIAGSAILQAITVQAAALLSERGIEPPIWVSANVEGGSEHNAALLERYRPQMARYPMGTTPSILSKRKQ
ncbi:MAG: SIS domain-containing protein [Chloroflexi bacterium]|nr:SIS domain-containing protein [Chloroflexota bacterium]MCC6891720.1 SIS domain-containing protein [Anaerolineae bacterium]